MQKMQKYVIFLEYGNVFCFFANIGFEKIGFRAAVDDPSKVCYNGLTPYNKKAWIPYSQPRRENWEDILGAFFAESPGPRSGER